MEPIKLEIFNKYLEIKQDLIRNLDEISLRKNYYTRKYRGNILTDINVGIFESEDNKREEFQIFIRFDKWYIKENTIFNGEGLYSTNVINNLYE